MANATLDDTPREVELYTLLQKAFVAFLDIQGVLQLLRDEGTIDGADFPNGVASAIRMIRSRVDAAVEEIDL